MVLLDSGGWVGTTRLVLRNVCVLRALVVTSHCALRRKDSLCALVCWFCVSRKGGIGGGWWGHPQGAMHMVAARLGFEKAVVGTRGPPMP